jgi:pyruvate dehydrogenase E2 component (dihydrolipoamide acetyltransferase)
VAEDVERAAAMPAAPAAAPAEVERVELTKIRRTIARRLTEAWTVPVFQLTLSADMTRANDVVRKHREANEDVRLTVTDVLTKICAQALMRHRAVNAQYTDDAILRFPTANVGIAVAAPSGLIVPVVRSAERLTLSQIAAARADVVERARGGKLRQEDLEDGTFTISNLGMPQYGIEQFVAVLNPPQAAILAVGATEERVVARDGELEILPMVTLTATFDHRAVDGADGAEFLATVKAFLEEPGLAL